MTRVQILTHEFVEYIPRELKDGVVYVSIPFATVIHKCCCGCGQQVVTPLSPSQWTLSFDGKSISLHPSIGNWNFPCKSHYWIKQIVSPGHRDGRNNRLPPRSVRMLLRLHTSLRFSSDPTNEPSPPLPLSPRNVKGGVLAVLSSDCSANRFPPRINRLADVSSRGGSIAGLGSLGVETLLLFPQLEKVEGRLFRI